jgi:hypothetical protein
MYSSPRGGPWWCESLHVAAGLRFSEREAAALLATGHRSQEIFFCAPVPHCTRASAASKINRARRRLPLGAA